MFLSAILISVVVPFSANPYKAAELIQKSYVVQAVIDSARIIGLPPSKAAKAYAIKIQSPDQMLKQITFISEPISSRKLFFRNYFSNGDT